MGATGVAGGSLRSDMRRGMGYAPMVRYKLSRSKDADTWDGPLVELEHLRWNDHGHRNTFRAYLKPTIDAPRKALGEVKILQRATRRPRLPESFEIIPEDCCSLGQSLEYYDAIASLGMLGEAILRGLRDLTFATELSDEFEEEPGYSHSLLRFPSARYLMDRAMKRLPASLAIRVTTSLAGLNEGQTVSLDLRFDPDRLGGRLSVLAGANGTGKTQLLARVAHAVVVDDELLTGQPKPALSRVLALSFSAFDQFALPRPPVQELYWYCGLQRRIRESVFSETTTVSVKPEDWGLDELFAEVCSSSRRVRWEEAMTHLELSCVIPKDGELKLLPRIRTLGAGHKMACLGFTHLLARLRPRTLVLFDEPELHTHPLLLSLMMRELSLLLEEYDSFAVISTHSPIVLQEVPAAQIHVLRREENRLRISQYPGESFGEDLNEIVRLGFGVDHDQRGYLKMLEREVERHGLVATRTKYSGSMGLAAHLALAALGENGDS